MMMMPTTTMMGDHYNETEEYDTGAEGGDADNDDDNKCDNDEDSDSFVAITTTMTATLMTQQRQG